MLTLTRTYYAEAAHRLTAGVSEGHPCRRLHGHRYVIRVSLTGEVGSDGMILEYARLDAIVQIPLGLIDHSDLNTLHERDEKGASVAENPTVERLIVWFADVLQRVVRGTRIKVARVSIEEDARSVVEWAP